MKHYLRLSQNNPQSAKSRTENAVKLVSKQVNERFCTYHGSGSFDRLKISSKLLKKNSEHRKTGFKYGKRTLLPVSWQRYFDRLKITSNVLKIEQQMP